MGSDGETKTNYITVTAVSADQKTGTGGIDPSKRIIKPTGILHLPRKEGRKEVSDRIDESAQIAADVSAKLAREFTDESAQIQRIEEQERAQAILDASMSEMDREIAILLRKKFRTEEDDLMLILLIAAAA